MIDIHGKRPPLPKKTGRRHCIKKKFLGGTVDPAVLELFQKEQARLHMPASHLLEEILWRYFNCPNLSFEMEE